MRHLLAVVISSALVVFVASALAQGAGQSASGNQAPGGGAKEQSRPRDQGSAPPGAPVETGVKSVPEFAPAFAGQTRAPAVKSSTPLRVTEVATGLNKPWSIAFLPDGRMLVTEKPTGELFIIANGRKSPAVSGLPPVDPRGQGGLLDVELSPDYGRSRLVYWSYYEPRDRGNGLAVARAQLSDGPQPRLDNVQVVFRMQPTIESTMHAGGRLIWAPDGTLFITLGDRSILPGRVQARDLSSHFGKIVRINPDGTTPTGNPFAGRPNVRPEVWSAGHRNILAAAIDGSGRLWEAEMGPRGGDELNRVDPGSDYGWPTIGYGEEYSGRPIHQMTQAPGLEQPVYYWDPVISPSGMAFYSGSLFPEWRNNLFIGGLSSKALVRLVLKDDRVVGEERLLIEQNARIRDVVQGPDGALYVATDDKDGKILRVAPDR